MGSLYILSAIFLWSSLGIVVKSAGMPLHDLIFYAMLVSLVIQGIMLAKGGGFSLPRGGQLLGVFILGPLSLLNNFAFFYAFRNTTIANAVLTHYTAPVIVAFLSPVFLKEPLTRRIAVSIAIASAGLWIMLGIRPGELAGVMAKPGRETVGLLAGLLSGFTYALMVILFRVYARDFRPLTLIFFLNLLTALMLLPFAGRLSSQGLWSVLVMGVIHSTLAPILYVKGMRLVTASRAAVLGYLEPVCAVLLGMLILGEYPGAYSVLGGALILISGFLTLIQDHISQNNINQNNS